MRLVAWPYAVATVILLGLWLFEVEHATTKLLHLVTFWATLPALALMVVAMLARDRRAVALVAVPAVTWVWAYGSAFVAFTPPEREPDLRVATFNTFVGTEGEDHVVDLVEATDPDVLLLQEVFPSREEALVAEFADRYPHVHLDRSEGVGAVAVFSRHPITEVRPVADSSGRSRATSVAQLDVGGRPVQVASVHLISPCPGCGPSVLERLELEDDVRRAEVGAVLAAIDADVPAIVGGDLNSNDRSSAYRRLVRAGFCDPQREVGSGMGFTWPADGVLPPLVRIDWVLTRDLEPIAAWVDEARGSDHRPVVVDVAFTDEAG